MPLAVELPDGLHREDEYFGEVEVYYNYVDILLQPERATGDATLALGSQGCADAGLCYPPQNQHFSIDFTSGSISAIDAPASAAPGEAK